MFLQLHLEISVFQSVCQAGFRLIEREQTKLQTKLLTLLAVVKRKMAKVVEMGQVAQAMPALGFSFQGSPGTAFCLISGLGTKIPETVHYVYFILPCIPI